ncbi:MAG: RNA polymerase sigma-70 factor [Cytophagales bacterium]|nr:RNA polymerase sigma-70 factor [Cytophagales bacterium]
MDTETIKQLLVGIANDNKRAFEKFFKVYHPRMIRFALLFVNRYADAEDVVSEVLIKLLKQRDKLPEINNFSGYLFTAVRNQSLHILKKYAQKPPVDLDDIPEDFLTDNYVEPFEKVLSKELREIVTDFVERLPPKRKMVYLLTKDEGLRIKQVAELLDITEKTVKKHLELAMRDLRNEVESYYSDNKTKTPVINIRKINLWMLL